MLSVNTTPALHERFPEVANYAFMSNNNEVEMTDALTYPVSFTDTIVCSRYLQAHFFKDPQE
jgi:hypothetical protein